MTRYPHRSRYAVARVLDDGRRVVVALCISPRDAASTAAELSDQTSEPALFSTVERFDGYALGDSWQGGSSAPPRAPGVRWKKRGPIDDPDGGHFAEIMRGGLYCCTLRVTRKIVGGVHRKQPVTEWRVAILEQDDKDRALLRPRLDVPMGCHATLAEAKAAAERELARIEAAERGPS